MCICSGDQNLLDIRNFREFKIVHSLINTLGKMLCGTSDPNTKLSYLVFLNKILVEFDYSTMKFGRSFQMTGMPITEVKVINKDYLFLRKGFTLELFNRQNFEIIDSIKLNFYINDIKLIGKNMYALATDNGLYFVKFNGTTINHLSNLF